MNSISKGGAITTIVGAGFGIFVSIIIFIKFLLINYEMTTWNIIQISFSIIVFIFSISIVLFAWFFLKDGSDNNRKICGILSLVVCGFNWIGYITIILTLVGGTLLLCSNLENK